MADYTEEDPLRTRERLDQIDKAQVIIEDKINMLMERLGPILPPALAVNGSINDFGNASAESALSEIDVRLDLIVRKAEEQGSKILTLMNRINL